MVPLKPSERRAIGLKVASQSKLSRQLFPAPVDRIEDRHGSGVCFHPPGFQEKGVVIAHNTEAIQVGEHFYGLLGSRSQCGYVA